MVRFVNNYQSNIVSFDFFIPDSVPERFDHCNITTATGFKVVSLNREISHPDIAAYNIAFNDAQHEILVKKPIDINSMEKDSVIAVANFIKMNPTLKAEVEKTNPLLLQKADLIRKERFISQMNRERFETLKNVNQ